MTRLLMVALMVMLPISAIAEDAAVSQTFACLDQPIVDNLAFNMCLVPLDQMAFEVIYDNAEALAALSQATNARTQVILAGIKTQWSPIEVEDFNRRKTAELEPLFVHCLNYEFNVEQSGEALSIARCNIIVEFTTLHFLYDNYYVHWRVEQ